MTNLGNVLEMMRRFLNPNTKNRLKDHYYVTFTGTLDSEGNMMSVVDTLRTFYPTEGEQILITQFYVGWEGIELKKPIPTNILKPLLTIPVLYLINLSNKDHYNIIQLMS